MDQVCLVFPVLPGRTDDARAFIAELENGRLVEYDRSERRIGITKEVWYLAPLPAGDHLVAYLESADFGRALRLFVESQDDFDLWFKRRLTETTGLDLHDLPPDLRLPELLSSYRA